MESLHQWASKGPFTLALSSSFFGFYAHAGVASALEEQGLEASKFTGSSAGAIVAALLGSGLRSEEIEKVIFSMKREDYWDPGFGPGLLKGEKFREIVERHCVKSFSETKKPVELAVFDLLSLRTKFLSQGSLAQAVVASCAVPGMFQPVRQGRRFLYDGGLLNKSGMAPQGRDSRVLCIYLDGGSWTAKFDWKKTSSQLGPEQKILLLKNLPRVHPLSFAQSREAYDEARKRCEDILHQPFSGSTIEA